MRTIQLVPQKTTQILPSILDKTYDPYLAVYQKILVLLLSKESPIYRTDGSTLISLLEGSNIPDSNFIQSIATAYCNTVIMSLDSEDRDLLDKASVSVVNGQLQLQIIMKNEETFKGILA